MFLDEEDKLAVTLQVKRGKIVRIDFGFAYPPEIREEDVARFLISPESAKP